MKYDVHIIKIIIKNKIFLFSTIIFILFALKSFSEEIPGPEGEQIIRQHFFKNNGQVSRIIATRYNLYSSHYSFAEGWSKAKRMFSIPNGKRIVEACQKFADNDENKTYCILLDDGTIYEFKYKPRTDYFVGNPRIIAGLTTSAEQNNFSNLLVSNELKLIYNNILYVNYLDGSGWKADTIGIGNFSVYSICLNSKGELFAGTNKGLFKKVSNQFQRINSVDTFSVATLFNDRKGRIHLNLSNRKTMISLDSGATFIDDSVNIGSRYVLRFGDDRWGNVYAITSTQYINRIYKKSFNNNYWERIDTNLTNYLGFYSSYNDIGGETTLEVSAYYGSYSSRDDGITWFSSNSGILAEDIYKFLILEDGKMLAYTVLGIFLKENEGSEWNKIFPKAGISSNYFLMNDKYSNLYTQINRTGQQNQGNIYKTNDFGQNWELDTAGIYILPRGYTGYSQLFVDEEGIQHYANSYVYGASTNFFRIYEKKSNSPWVLDTLGMGLSGVPTNKFYSISNFAYNNNNLYISGALWDYVSGTSYLNCGLLFKRKLNESVWEIDTSGIGDYAIYSLAFDKEGNLYAGSLALAGQISKIFKKTNNSWESIPVPPASATDVRVLSIDSSGNIWAVFNNTYFTTSMYRGIYTTADEGKTWEYAGFDSVIVRGLVYYDSNMFAYTGRGIHILSKAPFKQPVIQINPKVIDFGKIKPGKILDTLVTISNTGDDTLRIANITSSSSFFTTRTRLNIAPGASENIQIRFVPQSVMLYSFRMRIISNAYPDSIVLSGEGILTDSSAIISLNTKNIDFGEVRSGKTKDTVIIINNAGLETLKVYNIISSSNVFIVQDRVFELQPEMSKEITIRFAPTSIRNYNGYLYIQSNVLPDTVWLSGIGIEPSAPKLSLSLKTIDFGKVEVGQSKDTTVLFKNIGLDTLRVSYVRTFSESFFTSHHQFTLAPEEEIIVTITFRPQDEKVYDDFFAIVSNASPDTIFVKGEGYYYVNVPDFTKINSYYNIYPNPTTDKLYIKFNDDLLEFECLKIYNNLGNEVYKLKNSDIKQHNQFYVLDISNLPQGLYYITISNNIKNYFHLISIIK